MPTASTMAHPDTRRSKLLVPASFLLLAAVILGYRTVLRLLFRLLFFLIFIALSILAFNLGLSYYQQATRLKHSKFDQAHNYGLRRMAFSTPGAYKAALAAKSREIQTEWRKDALHPKAEGKVAEAVDVIFEMLIRDFVLKWYDDLVPAPYSPNSSEDTYASPAFPLRLEHLIRHALTALLARLSTLDLPTLLVSHILPIITLHLTAFRLASSELFAHTHAGPHSANDETDLLLARKHAEILARMTRAQKPKLHPAVDVPTPNTQLSERSHLRRLLTQILPLLLPAHEVASRTVSTIATEVVVGAVVAPVVDLLSDADFWNRLIEEKAGRVLRELQMVSQLREAVEREAAVVTAAAAAAGGASPSSAPSTAQTKQAQTGVDKISPSSTLKDFEGFARSIAKSPTLYDARRLRNDIETAIRKTESFLLRQSDLDAAPASGSSSGGDIGVSTAELHTYLDRLNHVRSRADRRIAELGGSASAASHAPSSNTSSAPTDSPRHTLDAILRDTESPALSYFMEFMDRRRRIMLVQFWLAVEGLKNPLEHEGLGGMGMGQGEEEGREREDLEGIKGVYFSDPGTVEQLGLRPRDVQPLLDFLNPPAGGDTKGMTTPEARRLLFAMQNRVFDSVLTEDWQAFAGGDLYLKATAQLSKRSASNPHPAPPAEPTVPIGRDSVAAPKPLSPLFTGPLLPRIARAMSYDSGPKLSTKLSSISAPPTPPPSDVSQASSSVSLAAPWRRPGASRLQRTATAAPQVTLRAAFDERPPGQRLTSTDSPSGLGYGYGSGSRIAPKQNMSASLDFLMSPAAVDRAPLFGEEAGDDGAGSSLFGALGKDDVEPEIGEAASQALQDALTSIILTGEDGASTPRAQQHPRAAGNSSNSSPSSIHAEPPKRVPRKGSEHGAGTGSTVVGSAVDKRKSLFDDDDADDSGAEERTGLKGLGLGLGLGLGPALGQVGMGGGAAAAAKVVSTTEADAKIASLENQLSLLSGLMRKAELTGSKAEIRLLTRSIDAVTEELSQATFQKAQLAAQASQESKTRLTPGRTTVSISGTTIGQSAGTEFVLYLVEVHKLADDGSFASGWIVTRRYSEFSALQTALREKYPISRSLELPAKTLGTGTNSVLVEHRKTGLERYLKSLVRIPVLCQSSELSIFLSRSNISLPAPDAFAGLRKQMELLPGHSIVRSFYNSVTTGIDGLAGASMLEALMGGLRQQATDFAGAIGSTIYADDVLSSSVNSLQGGETMGGDALSALPSNVRPLDGEGVTAFTAPICDILVEVFELNDKNQWLRKQGIVIVLQQILGGTIERKLREGVTQHLQEDHLTQLLSGVQDALWPDGQLKLQSVPRTKAEKAATRDAAYRKLTALMPDLAASVLGRSNARKGARRVFTVCQNQRLNRHIIYTIIDELLRAIFPEIDV